MHLIAAGLGDTLGKYTCLLDWKLANMITGEYYCPEVVEMVRTALRIYHRLAQEQPDFDAAMARPYDQAAWEEKMRALYGAAADGIIALEQKAGKNDVAKRDKRLAVIKEKWEEIRRAIQEDLPAAEEMAALLRSLGAPTEPEEINIPAARAREAVVVAKEVRDRYTLLQLLWDLGLAEQYAASAE